MRSIFAASSRQPSWKPVGRFVVPGGSREFEELLGLAKEALTASTELRRVAVLGRLIESLAVLAEDEHGGDGQPRAQTRRNG